MLENMSSSAEWWEDKMQRRGRLTHPSACHQLERGWLMSWAVWKRSHPIGCWRKTISPDWQGTLEESGCYTLNVKGSLKESRQECRLFTGTEVTSRGCVSRTEQYLCLIRRSESNESEESWCVQPETVEHQGRLKKTTRIISGSLHPRQQLNSCLRFSIQVVLQTVFIGFLHKNNTIN